MQVKETMANTKLHKLLFILLLTLILAPKLIQGTQTGGMVFPFQSSEPQTVPSLQEVKGGWRKKNSRRLMIGSTAPTCTFNECRGCKYKCSAEQVPVEGNDPINSPYHYRCVCHRR